MIGGLDDFARFRSGDVLVCRTTSPAWTPLLARAAAVVTEIGGVLAHAAIVAREFGIPAVTAADHATTVLVGGLRVVVNGTRGSVATDQNEHSAPRADRGAQVSGATPTGLLVLHAVRTLGYADTARIATRLSLRGDETREHLLDAQAHGWMIFSSFAGDEGWLLTESGKAHGERLLAAELDQAGARAAVEKLYQHFLPLNDVASGACTAWQLAEMGIGAQTVTLAETIAALEGPAAALAGLESHLTARLDRFSGYHQRSRQNGRAHRVAAGRTSTGSVLGHPVRRRSRPVRPVR